MSRLISRQAAAGIKIKEECALNIKHERGSDVDELIASARGKRIKTTRTFKTIEVVDLESEELDTSVLD